VKLKNCTDLCVSLRLSDKVGGKFLLKNTFEFLFTQSFNSIVFRSETERLHERYTYYNIFKFNSNRFELTFKNFRMHVRHKILQSIRALLWRRYPHWPQPSTHPLPNGQTQRSFCGARLVRFWLHGSCRALYLPDSGNFLTLIDVKIIFFRCVTQLRTSDFPWGACFFYPHLS
jgi:hypothetical protein